MVADLWPGCGHPRTDANTSTKRDSRDGHEYRRCKRCFHLYLDDRKRSLDTLHPACADWAPPQRPGI